MKYNNLNGKGIEITYVDGTTKHFDPITDWNETEENFSFYLSNFCFTRLDTNRDPLINFAFEPTDNTFSYLNLMRKAVLLNVGIDRASG